MGFVYVHVSSIHALCKYLRCDPAIPVTVDTLQNPSASEGLNTTTVTRIVTPTPTICVTCKAPRISEGRKKTTATRIATPTPAIPVIVHVFLKSQRFTQNTFFDRKNVF